LRAKKKESRTDKKRMGADAHSSTSANPKPQKKNTMRGKKGKLASKERKDMSSRGQFEQGKQNGG